MKKKFLAGVLAVAGVSALAASLAACTAEETHNYSGDWKADDKFHWHECTDENCAQKDGLTSHSWDNGTVTKEAACGAAGEKTYECTVCRKTRTEEVKQLAHNWVLQEDAGEASTCTKKGFAVYKCSLCKEEDNRELPLAAHATGDEKNAYYHWTECENCDYSTEQTAHTYTFDNGKITCADCGNEINSVTASGTLASPSALSASAAEYSLLLNQSDDFETENGYFAGYFTITPTDNITLTFTSARHAHGSYAAGYYETQSGAGGEYNLYYPVTAKESIDGDNFVSSFELEAGKEYTVSVTKNKSHGAYIALSTSVHVHEYDLTAWQSDGDYHWHTATCHASAAVKDKAAHIFDAEGKCVCGKVTAVESPYLQYAFNDEDHTATVTQWKPPANNRPVSVSIPAKKINNGVEYTVTKILGTTNVFQSDNLLERITLPSTITEIPANAFKGCEKLKTLHLIGGSTEEVINAWCNVTLGNTFSNPFYQSKSGDIYVNGTLLEDLELTLDKDLPANLFAYCTSLKTVKLTVAAGVTDPVVINNAFMNCSNLKCVEIGEGITELNTFRSCASLESVIVSNHNSITFGSFAFAACANLSKIYFNGTSAQWDEVKECWTAKLSSATVYFYSEEPEAEGNFWHLVGGAPAVWD